MRVLLHACCGPCLLEPLDELGADHEVEVVYANPNIHPDEEYRRRRDTLLGYAERIGVRVHEAPYEPAEWMRAVGEDLEAPSRCTACYRLRLGAAASLAAERDFDAVATTLTVSPYQDPDRIEAAGVDAVEPFGIRYLHADFRPRYRRAVERSKGLGMYRQRYCGCLLSDVEARKQRDARRSARR